jgi:dTDP-4-amino-4,6-dideoxygalactose transaminase
MTALTVPFHRPSIGDAEIAEVCDSLRSGWLTAGPKVAAFEQAFAEFVGARHALAVNSATAALHLALEATGVGPGDRVLTTPYTFTATAEVVRYLGADPLFADIDPATFNLCPRAATAALAATPVKAIIPVHFAGRATGRRRGARAANRYRSRPRRRAGGADSVQLLRHQTAGHRRGRHAHH